MVRRQLGHQITAETILNSSGFETYPLNVRPEEPTVAKYVGSGTNIRASLYVFTY